MKPDHSTLINFHQQLTSHYASRKVVLTEGRYYDELCRRFPIFATPKYAKKVSRVHSGIPRMYRQKGYPKDKKDLPKFKRRVAKWYIDRYIFLFGKPVCTHCGSSSGSIFDKLYNALDAIRVNALFMYCSESCSKANLTARAKRAATTLERYGVTNVTYSKELRKHAADWMKCPIRLSARQAKTTETLIRKHGSVKEATSARLSKARATNLAKYGGPAPTCCPDILRKRDSNYFKKFGVRNPSQNPEVMSKIVRARGKGRPRYTSTIHGKVFEGLQGAEAECIDLLIKLGVDPNNINVYKKGVNYTFQNIRRVYFPDLLVTTPSGEQWLLEVKSVYTAGISKAGGVTKDGHAHLPKLRAKFRGALLENLNIALAIPHKGRLFIHKGSIPSRAALLKSFTSWLTSTLQ